MQNTPSQTTIAQVIFPFLGSEMGGSHVSSFTLANQLQAEGIRVVVACREDSLIAQEARRLGLTIDASWEAPATRNNPLTDLARLPNRLGRLKRLRQPGTLMHCNDIATLQAWLLPARLARVPILYHHRSINRMLMPNRLLLEQADGTIVISEECQANVSFLPANRVRKILNPFSMNTSVDRQAARAELLQDCNLPTESHLIGFVGNFWNRKRPFFFLSIAAEIARADPDARFVLFGRDGEITRGELERRSESLGIASRTVFPGFRLPGERNIAALDVVLAPAIREPFGRTLVEAVLVGTPYVATDDAGHSEIFSRWGGGILLPRDLDAAAFARQALEVINAIVDPRLNMSSRAIVRDEVSPEVHARTVVAFYNSLLIAKRPFLGLYK